MMSRLCLLLYRVVLWRAYFMSPERGRSLRARWALRFHALTTGGVDDDFAAELFDLVQQMPELLINWNNRRPAGQGAHAKSAC